MHDSIRVLVCYASRHGATAGIAERIADELSLAGLDVDCRPVVEVDSIDEYDAFVIGGAAYMLHWMRDVTRFVKRHRRTLAMRPVWMFSSGPTGTERVDSEGRDLLDVSRPKEFSRLESMVGPIETKVFFGAWDPDAAPIGLVERFAHAVPAARSVMPSGDFRDWAAIDSWATEVASVLSHETPRGLHDGAW